ncbi:MAG: HlyD family type I secretion periplasmic adaptor subunit, partial [Rhizobiaceae bacterium]|nr:HlyD family type I secretion periplasmic adaptor subunit [Rhizobiaceae bacterium]
VQHLEGGIISDILVREGDVVKAGQTLYRLDPTTALAQRDRYRYQAISLGARATRLVAERDGIETIEFPQSLISRSQETGTEQLLDEQKKEFTARFERHRQEEVILRQRVNALNEQIVGTGAQATAIETQLNVVREETERKRLLLEKGLTDRSEYTALLRSEADLVGQAGQLSAQILSSKTQIVEAEEQLARLKTQRVETAAQELNEVRNQSLDSGEALRAAEAVLLRIDVRSPSDGIVVETIYNSVGSVVKPGDTLLQLLPTNDNLLIEARLSPTDIDVVSIGQAATLRFTALNARTTPVVDATVTYISADRLVDPADQQPYYVARLAMTEALPPEITPSQIYPGMPVETYLRTADRTFFQYLGQPIADSFSRAFREE